MYQTAAAHDPLVPAVHRRRVRTRPRIAVVLASDRGPWQESRAVEIARAVAGGAAAHGREVEIVLAPVGAAVAEPTSPLRGVAEPMRVRPHQWRVVQPDESRRAAAYAGVHGVAERVHLVPDDGIRQFLDCDLWLVVDPRLSAPLLPMRPSLVLLDDWLHHAAGTLSGDAIRSLADTVGSAGAVAVFSEWMRREANAFLGVREDRLVRLPRFLPRRHDALRSAPEHADHFVWFVAPEPFEGLSIACEALRRAVRRHGGRTACRIVPLESAATVGEDLPLPEEVRGLIEDAAMDGRVVLSRQPADSQETIAAEASSAAFVWQPSPFDDGRLVVAEAARSGAGCVVADSPPNREIASWLGSHGLAGGLAWADPADPVSIADALAAGVSRPASPSTDAPALAETAPEACWAAVERLL